jgi:hypothetical protein
MAGRVLSFSDYIGGADNVQVVEMLPKQSKKYVYDFGTDVSTYTFLVDFSTVVLSNVTYDRVTGDPNFTDTVVKGYLGNSSYTVDPATYVSTTNAASGLVEFTIPPDRYLGFIYPDARTNVVMTIMEFAWTTADTPPQTDSHRWAIIERYTADVIAGDPTSVSNAPAFTSIEVV